MAKCVLCDDTGYRGTDAYGERVRCGCRREEATTGTTKVAANARDRAGEAQAEIGRLTGILWGKGIGLDDVLAELKRREGVTQEQTKAAPATRSGPWVALDPGLQIIPPQPAVTCVELKRGDRLVVTAPDNSSPAGLERLHDRVKAWAGDVPVLVLRDSCRLTVLGREDVPGEPGE